MELYLSLMTQCRIITIAEKCNLELSGMQEAVGMLSQVFEGDEHRQQDLIEFLREQGLSMQALSLGPLRLAGYQSQTDDKVKRDLIEFKRFSAMTEAVVRAMGTDATLKNRGFMSPFSDEESQTERDKACAVHRERVRKARGECENPTSSVNCGVPRWKRSKL